jgi:iron(III) transport system substrate-binding protein
MPVSPRVLAATSGLLGAALVLTACGSSSTSSAGTTLTVYNAQHEDLTKALADAYTKKTGVKISIRNGKDAELGNLITQEGSASKADVFLTENSPSMTLVDGKGLLSKLGDDTLAQVPTQFKPSDGDWTGFAARSTVFVYNPSLLSTDQLPKSLLDLQNPSWQGKFAVSAGGADFQAIVSAVLATKGETATAAWLKGIKDNAKLYKTNSSILKSVNAGELAGGVIYHYYWYQDQADSGANSSKTKLEFFGNQDPGAFVSTSGAGVLKASKQQDAAQAFVKYLTSAEGQTILANSKALEYTVGSNVTANKALKPMSELQPPTVDIAKLNGPKVIELMQTAGLL